jgi:hypothetical protein
LGDSVVKVLVTGNGTGGSWSIRGCQLGEAIGATVRAKAIDIGPFDLAVVVKRAKPDLMARIHQAQVPLIYDVVDAWPQPEGNRWDRATCVSWLTDQVRRMRPAGIVAATQAMADDCKQFGVPVLALPHHVRPGIKRNPIRETVQTVGYEGGLDYIAQWRHAIEAECSRRGWRFVVNPENLADLDIVLALRDSDGYAPRTYKSNVKLANAQGSGTPFIGSPEAGYMEQSVGVERFVETAEALRLAFNALTPQAERRRVSGWMLSVAPTLEQVAAKYAEWLKSCFETARNC